MSADNELGEALTAFVKSMVRGHLTVEGEIVSIDQGKYTAEVSIGGATFRNVPLRVLINNRASCVEFPAVGTTVLMSFRDGNIQRPTIVGIHEATDLLMNYDQVTFNEGQLGGLVKVISLTDRLNKIEQWINTFKGSYDAHTHNVTAVGSPTGPNLAPAPGNLTPTQRGDIENNKIKQ